MIEGENFCVFVGKLVKPVFNLVGDGNHPMLKASLAIPTTDGGKQYIKITAWYNNAEALNEVGTKQFVKIHAHIEESSFDGKCRHCGGSEKKYWTTAVVDNFVILNEEE